MLKIYNLEERKIRQHFITFEKRFSSYFITYRLDNANRIALADIHEVYYNYEKH